MDDGVLSYIALANIAHRFHRGSPILMGKTLNIATRIMGCIGTYTDCPELMDFGKERHKNLYGRGENLTLKKVIVTIKDGKAETIKGKKIEIKADSICVYMVTQKQSISQRR